MIATVIVGCLVCFAADAKSWDEFFPALENFGRMPATPKIEKNAKDEKPVAWSQTVDYEWLGGRYEHHTITLARDAKFKEQYSAEAMKKAKYEKLEVNKKTAYLWNREQPDKLEDVNKRLVVILADDKVLIIEQKGFGLDLANIAKKFDFDKVIAAMDTPPAVKK
jgi:hypothetical protein